MKMSTKCLLVILLLSVYCKAQEINTDEVEIIAKPSVSQPPLSPVDEGPGTEERPEEQPGDERGKIVLSE